MTLWIVLTILASVVAVALAVPVIRRLEVPRSDQERLFQVGRDQLAEIEAERAGGNLSDSDAAEARAEVERRTLAVARSAAPSLRPSSNRARAWAIAAVIGWVVAGATGLYAYLGRPDLPARPAQDSMAQTQPAPTQAADATDGTVAAAGMGKAGTGSVEEAISGLVARLDANPNDAESWRMLGWSYFNTERYAEAAKAYGKSVELDGSKPEIWSAYGETLVRSARGRVTDESLKAFDAALKLNPDDPRARFFKGMALEQAGDPKAAVEAWITLAEAAPSGADWLPGVLTRIDELAAANTIELGTRLDKVRADSLAQLPPPSDSTPSGSAPAGSAPAAAAGTADRGPTAADVAAAQGMAPADRQAMIQGMVEQLAARLKDNPDDPDGWVKLIRSRMVLQDAEGAASAYADAKSALTASPDKLAIVTEGARAAGLETN